MKNSWPIALILFFIAVFAAVIAFVLFTQRHRVDLVAPDYYAQSLTHEAYLDSVRRAQQFTNTPILEIEGRVVRITIPNPLGATGEVHLYRPADARLDQRLPLALDAEGRQQLDLTTLAPGPWRVQLTWSVSNLSYATDRLTVLP